MWSCAPPSHHPRLPAFGAGAQVCLFAYGQTGSGKTYTMQGGTEPATWGLIPRALSKILQLSNAMREDGWEWTLTASFLEIYNESLRDLLHVCRAETRALALHALARR